MEFFHPWIGMKVDISDRQAEICTETSHLAVTSHLAELTGEAEYHTHSNDTRNIASR